jgi:hypothetical protein
MSENYWHYFSRHKVRKKWHSVCRSYVIKIIDAMSADAIHGADIFIQKFVFILYISFLIWHPDSHKIGIFNKKHCLYGKYTKFCVACGTRRLCSREHIKIRHCGAVYFLFENTIYTVRCFESVEVFESFEVFWKIAVNWKCFFRIEMPNFNV